ncbi:hypothetical protein MNBD_GAMMA23-1738 [hydrothermal vent metagenome]|uniref:VWFA domain-containing protein n=1 Tax=hydrothermal vent metagenome TaxID=652676 RepID=A0A3B1A9M0_9ZZZZ
MNLKSVFSQKWAMRCLSRSLFIIFALSANPVFALSEPVSDVRVIIDVSGSMKKNDPKNLRAPALRMLVGLMPSKAKSGVWTFGKYVNMQVKHGKVTVAWKKLAMLESKKIHSRGLYTNIEEALKRSSQGWDKPNRKERRHLILLTDGMVDISKNAEENEASRKRILNDIAPKLKKAGVSIHTIALSANADKKLMAALAGMTDGWYEAVDNAEDLQRVFLHIFEKSTKVDTVPLEDNRFSIDKSIKDMTVLVFRKPGDSETKLITPDKKTWSYKKHPAAVKWHHDTGYDLISSKDPQVGQWLIKATVDPDNRVMVVTNLKLTIGDFPNNIMYGDSLTLTAKLIQEGKTVTQERLLKLVNFNVYKHAMTEQPAAHHASANAAGHDNAATAMIDDGSGADRLAIDGVYSVAFNADQANGDVSLIIQAKSPAFEREVRHIIKIHATPADLDIKQQADGQFKLEVTPRMELLVPHTVSIQVTLPDGSKKTLQQNDDDKWHALLAKEFTGQRVTVTLVGTRVNDKPFHVDFDKILEVSKLGEQNLSLDTQAAHAPAVDASPLLPVPDELAPVAHEEKPSDVAEKSAESEKDAGKQEQGFNWLSTMMIIIYANIIFLILGGIGYLVWRKRKAKLATEQEEMDL